MTIRDKLELAYQKDPEIFCDRNKLDQTFGSNPAYLADIHNITKSDLLKLAKKGLAVKTRYVVQKTGEHRVRWLIFNEAVMSAVENVEKSGSGNEPQSSTPKDGTSTSTEPANAGTGSSALPASTEK